MLVVLVALAMTMTACGSDRSGALVEEDDTATSFDYDYLIPLGTGDRISAGDPVDILPAELTVRVGEFIRIVNEDDEGHFVGIFFVGAGETVTQRFASAGEFVGACSVHPSGQLTLEVRE
jgi:plastocyanin